MNFDLTRKEYEACKEEMMLSEEESTVFEMRITGCSIVQISMKLHISVATVNRRIKKIKKKLLKVLK